MSVRNAKLDVQMLTRLHSAGIGVDVVLDATVDCDPFAFLLDDVPRGGCACMLHEPTDSGKGRFENTEEVEIEANMHWING